MTIIEDILGKVVYSKTGRDKGRAFIVVGVINERLVLLADGDMRKTETPKTKNVKHIQFTKIKADDIVAIIGQGGIPPNHILRKYLKAISTDGGTEWEGGLVNG